jgi:hypothetical protein
MKMVKSLMLGTAAGFVALTGAQAADLPVKAKPVEYVKICSLYGAGFYYIPGTDTCIRIGGAIRLDVAFNGGTYDTAFWQGGAASTNGYNRNYYTDRERFNLFVDTRTATEYGVLRTYANLQFDFLPGRESIAGGYIENDFIFIQFAGFTFGKAVSQFDPQWALAKPTIASGFLAGSNDATGIPQLAYTASFGNGLSGTISLEDAQPYRDAGLINTNQPFIAPFAAGILGYGTAANSFLGNSYGGNHVPDIVGNLRIDQAWGSAQVAAAAHNINGTYYGGVNGIGGIALPVTTAGLYQNGHPSDTWGFAIEGAFELKNLPTGVGDSLKVNATYADGAAKYVFGGTVDTVGAGRFSRATSTSVGWAYVLDGVYSNPAGLTGGSIEKSKAWEVDAYFEHYWNPAWRTSVFGSYNHISYGSAGDAALTAAYTAGVGGVNLATFGALSGTSGSWTANLVQVGTKTAWTPVQNLTFSAEFIWSHIDQNLGGTLTTAIANSVPGYPGGSVFQIRDQNAYNGALQVLRSF